MAANVLQAGEGNTVRNQVSLQNYHSICSKIYKVCSSWRRFFLIVSLFQIVHQRFWTWPVTWRETWTPAKRSHVLQQAIHCLAIWVLSYASWKAPFLRWKSQKYKKLHMKLKKGMFVKNEKLESNVSIFLTWQSLWLSAVDFLGIPHYHGLQKKHSSLWDSTAVYRA